ncbi:MAG: YchF/TatD family DNA exonuclease [Sylvanvirus sp.]|uniref:YchF/TatD family DNA exonuclease n=1 Tax=Sylvanvirus sp. TaxID=2487774 RepID=A0A3G5AH58_9VIRU|nr:MAG: YchF/TatD family DNA exonuclease [Sylvanvirus sp.]
MFDIGVNFSCKQFQAYRKEYLDHAYNEWIEGIVCISNSRPEWDSNMKWIEIYKDHAINLYMTIGIHPHSAKNATEQTFKDMIDYLKNPLVVAVGECGLDYNRMFSPKEKQIEVFKRHIELAINVQKPLYLHDREATKDMLHILSEYKELTGVVHCFTGSKETLKEYLKMGFYIGITGWICDTTRNKDLVEAIKELPLDRLLLETDSPWLIPPTYAKQFKTRRNESDSLPHIVLSISQYTGHTPKDIIEASNINTRMLFKLTTDIKAHKGAHIMNLNES